MTPTPAQLLEPRGLQRYLPILHWLPKYDRSWLSADLLAGVSVWALLVPQSLAYASLAGVPVQYGLYTAFAALVVYAVFGTSRQMTVGPSSTVAAVTAAVIAPLVGADAPGLVARIDGPLFFANANRIRDDITTMIRRAEAPVRAVVLDMEAVSQSDTDGADVLAQLTRELSDRDITVGLARIEHDVLALWERAGTVDVVGTDRTFSSIHEAVDTLAPTSADLPHTRRPVEQ
jgi:MFS superfamily sulfate permease-like transporter